MEQPVSAASKPAGPEKESWYRYRLKEEQETPQRLEDAAGCSELWTAVTRTRTPTWRGSSACMTGPGQSATYSARFAT